MAVAHWNYWSVGTLENAIIFIWAAMQTNTQASVVTSWSLAFAQIPALVLAHVLKPITTADIFYKTTTSFTLILVFGVWTAWKDTAKAKHA